MGATMRPDTQNPGNLTQPPLQRLHVTGADMVLPGDGLDLEPMPALVRGHCNWCAGPLPRGRAKTCGDDCGRRWESAMRSHGRSLAERSLFMALHRRKSPMPKVARRAFSESNQLARTLLRRLREMQRGETDGK